MNEALYELFREPTAAYRGKPFWSWNGKLEKEEMLRQIHVFKEMGMGGFFMHSRTGLATEYLGEEWFELINACADEAEKLGLEAWLYDEDRWPSGTAGGLVTQEPAYRMKFIRLETLPVHEFQWRDELTAAFSCRLRDEVEVYDCRRLSREECLSGHLAEEDGERRVLAFSVTEMEASSFYNGYTYLDTMNLEATEAFLSMTHEQYKKNSGNRFGKSIKGIFTDEPHRGPLFSGFSLRTEERLNYAPWTYKLFAAFQQKYGYSLEDHLPELFLLPEGRKVVQVKWHYVELLQEMFLDHFAKPMRKWCQEQGLILTGHILHEDDLTSQTAMSGSVMRYYEHLEYPGIDILTEGNGAFWAAKQLSSVARQLGQKWMMSELYGCTGWQMTMEGHKYIGNWQALFGINVRCHHLSWYTMEGESKRDYPGSIFYQSAWYKEYAAVETYFSRLGVVLATGKPVCDVLVINPVESVWAQVYVGWCEGLVPSSPEVIRIEQMYRDTFHWLAGARIDFDYGDEGMLPELSEISLGDDGTVRLRIGQMEYRIVVVAGLTTIRASTLRILDGFMKAGGQVIFAGEVPSCVDALESGACLKLAASGMSIPLTEGDLATACASAASRFVEMVNEEDGSPVTDVYCQVREDDGIRYVVLINMNRNREYRLRITARHEGGIEEWNCLTGERAAITAEYASRAREDLASSATTMHWTAVFPPSGEHVYKFTPHPHPELAAVPAKLETVETKALDGSYAFRLDEPNVCVLDMASFQMDGGVWQSATEILKVDRQVRAHYGLALRGGEMVQPWFQHAHRPFSQQVLGVLALRFEFEVEQIPEEEIMLAVEHSEQFIISCNGRRLEGPLDAGVWVDRCFGKIPLPSEFLIEGKNVIDLTVDFHEGINLEALYLLGPFGVTLHGSQKMLTALPQRLRVGSLTEQGLPFYSGTVTYRVDTISITVPVGARVLLSFGAFEGACLKVRSTKGEALLLWPPYEADVTQAVMEGSALEVDVILTRRNTFGPLHLLPTLAESYTPEHFITEGTAFSEAYCLIPSGLLQAPVLEIRRSDAARDVEPKPDGV